MIAYYPWLKLLHVSCVAASLALFLLRSGWRWRGSPLQHKAWARWVPQANDTVLLLAGLSLALLLHQYPFRDAWLTAKLAGLLVHIGLGMLALRRGLAPALRGAAWLGSLGAFAYVLAVALTRDPTPWS